MPFDPYAPRMQLRARQVREGDYLRLLDDRWGLVKLVDLSWPDAAIELEGHTTLSLDKDAEVEVSRRVKWVEVDDRFRVIDTFPYLDREDEFNDLTIGEAAGKVEDLTGVGADVILSDLDEPDSGGRWEWTDDETGREVSLVPEVEPDPNRKVPPPTPEAGGMSTTDGLGG